MTNNANTDANYELVNIYDDVVRSTIKNIMDRTDDMCKCEKCYLDACVYVFNNGFVRFSTTTEGSVIAGILEMSGDKKAELMVLANEAVQLVKEKPNHK